MMRRKTAFIAAAGLAICGTAWAEEAGEKELKAAQQEVDREAASAASKESKVESLAQQFNIDSAKVQQMRDERQGWGEISTQLALAQRLSKTDPGTYPTTTDALGRVESLRDQGKGYGGIAKELGFKLGPVVSDVNRSRNAIRASARADQPETSGKADRPEKTGRVDQSERPDKPGRPDRPEKPDHPGK